jgi:hypothetical protein
MKPPLPERVTSADPPEPASCPDWQVMVFFHGFFKRTIEAALMHPFGIPSLSLTGRCANGIPVAIQILIQIPSHGNPAV